MTMGTATQKGTLNGSTGGTSPSAVTREAPINSAVA